MPIRRAGFRGALFGGVGDTLQDYAALRLKRREADRLLQQQRAWDIQKMQIEALTKMSDKVAENPLLAHQYLQAARGNPLLAGLGAQMQGLQQPDPVLADYLKNQIAGVEDPLKLQNLGTQAKFAGIDTTQVPATAPAAPGAPPLDFRPQEMAPTNQLTTQLHDDSLPVPPQLGEPPPLPPVPPVAPPTPQIAPADDVLAKLKAQFPSNNPLMTDIQRAGVERGTQIRQAQQEKIALEGQTAEQKAFGTAQGTARSAHGYADTVAQDELAKLQLLGPEKVKQAGETTGATTTAELNAKTTPDAIRQAAALESALATARENAQIAGIQKKIRENILDPQRQAAALQLSDNFRQETAPFRTKELSFRTIMAAAGPEMQKDEKDLSAAASLSIIFAYMKLLDPLSAVQKGEQASAENARGVPEDVRAMYNRITGGAKLTQTQIRDFTHQAFNQYQGAKEMQTRAIQDYSVKAGLLHVDPLLVVSQPDAGLDTDITLAAGADADAVMKR